LFDASVTATTLEGANQVISLGPVASQEAIKQLGINGGGFFNVNAAHPFENPTAWSNYLNIFAMLSISSALVDAFGQMVGNRCPGWALLAAMAFLRCMLRIHEIGHDYFAAFAHSGICHSMLMLSAQSFDSLRPG
jgi:K+-transporting ATPase A subunit